MTIRLLILEKCWRIQFLQRENALRLHCKDHLIKSGPGIIVVFVVNRGKNAQFVSAKSGGIYSRIMSVFLRVKHTKPNKKNQPYPYWESISSSSRQELPAHYDTHCSLPCPRRTRYLSLSGARWIHTAPSHSISFQSYFTAISHPHLGLLSGLFLSGFTIKIP